MTVVASSIEFVVDGSEQMERSKPGVYVKISKAVRTASIGTC